MIKMWCPCVSLIREGQETPSYCMWSGHVPLAVEVPNSVGVSARGAGVGAEASVGGGVGATTGNDASVGVDKEFDWLNEDLEGENFANDIFGEFSPPHTIPFKPNIIPTTDTP